VADEPSIKIVKTIAHRGTTREWSNRYHFSGGTPADSAHWTTLANAVIASEKTLYPAGIPIVRAVGYAAGSDVPVFTLAVNVPGTLVPAANDTGCPSEVVGLLRFTTDQRTSKNHPIYLFNYFHGAYYAGLVSTDAIAPHWQNAVNNYGTAWRTGFSDGTNTLVRCGPRGAVATSNLCESYLTHRDFPR
jgi:hypothetical protein